MFPDKPAPTITTGFLSPGRGRFTHPNYSKVFNTLWKEQDYSHFLVSLIGWNNDIILKRNAHAKLIGGAVPPCLVLFSYIFIFSV